MLMDSMGRNNTSRNLRITPGARCRNTLSQSSGGSVTGRDGGWRDMSHPASGSQPQVIPPNAISSGFPRGDAVVDVHVRCAVVCNGHYRYTGATLRAMRAIIYNLNEYKVQMLSAYTSGRDKKQNEASESSRCTTGRPPFFNQL